MTDTRLLKDLISGSGLKREYIAAKLGCTMPTLRFKIAGKYEFKQSEIKTLARLLGLDMQTTFAVFFS